MLYHHFNGQIYDAGSIDTLVATNGVKITIEADTTIENDRAYVSNKLALPVVIAIDTQYHLFAIPANFPGDQYVDVILITKHTLKKIKVS